MKVMVLGIRGLPGVQGGIETHAEHLYERLAALGCAIEAIVRTPFVSPGVTHSGAIRIRRIWSPRSPGAEALLHSLIGVLYAGIRRPDVLHIHAIGPSIVTPLARLLGLRVVVTHHGPDYDRDKWGTIARSVLRTGERFGMRYSNARIAISKVIADIIRVRYHRDSTLIPNGVSCGQISSETDCIAAFGLEPRRYILQVSRMVPEKRQLDLIRAFSASPHETWKLALVGGSSGDEYSLRVRAAAAQVPGVVLTDFQTGRSLAQLYSHAGAFVLPSSHEGLPIALLEALSYGLRVLASDIPAHLEIGLEAGSYFRLGDEAELTSGLTRLVRATDQESARTERRAWVAQRYDWGRIARQTLEVYRHALEQP